MMSWPRPRQPTLNGYSAYNMQNILMVIVISLLLGLAGLMVFYFRKMAAPKGPDQSAETLKAVMDLMKSSQASSMDLAKMTAQELQSTRQEVQKVLNSNTSSLQQQIAESNKAINERLDNAARVVASVNKELGQVQEMGRHMRELQDFLKSPKLRGNVGEQVMRDLLEQCLSKGQCDFQYKFKEGQIVDAVIKTDKGIIPVDSKFPMDNFQKLMKAATEEERVAMLHEFAKDVKKHITDISRKYILPGEGTLDFAVMYVPSEAIYYEIVRHEEDLNNFANQKKIFIVSPNTFYYFLRVILLGLEGKRIEAAAKKILEVLGAIKTDNEKFSQHLGVMTTHITNAKAAVDRVNNEYSKLTSRIDQVALLKAGD